jgi:hypothetical protein
VTLPVVRAHGGLRGQMPGKVACLHPCLEILQEMMTLWRQTMSSTVSALKTGHRAVGGPKAPEQKMAPHESLTRSEGTAIVTIINRYDHPSDDRSPYDGMKPPRGKPRGIAFCSDPSFRA